MAWGDEGGWADGADWGGEEFWRIRRRRDRDNVPDPPLLLAVWSSVALTAVVVSVPMQLIFGRAFFWVAYVSVIVGAAGDLCAGWGGYVTARRGWRGAFFPWPVRRWVRYHRVCLRQIRFAVQGPRYPGWPATRPGRPGMTTLYRRGPNKDPHDDRLS